MNINVFNESASIEQFLTSDFFELYIKRDDLIHPIVSGNKWRKLKFVLAHCKSNNFTEMITFGGAYSNHTLACACVCALFDIKLTIVARGEKSEQSNHYQHFLDAFRARVIYVSRTDYKSKKDILEKLEVNEKNIFVLEEGGKHELANKGCMEIISSLKQNYDAIFLASGTGTTALGIAKAIDLYKLNTKLFVVPVLKNELEIEVLLKDFAFVKVIYDAHYGGYAKTSKAIFDTIDDVLFKYGIMLDPIYTSKAYIAMMKEKESFSGKKVLFLHTGGTLGLFSKQMIENWDKAKNTFLLK